MNKRLLFLVSFFFAGLIEPSAQCIYPANNHVLNYTQVMFEYREVPAAALYKIFVFLVKRHPQTGKEILIKSYEATDHTTAHLASFNFVYGSSYQWYYEAFNDNGNKKFTSAKSRFYTGTSRMLDNFRFSVTQYDSNNVGKKDLIITDYGVVLDRKGQVVLYLDTVTPALRDLSMTRQGTFIFTDEYQAEERNLNNKRIWKSADLKYNDYLICDYHHAIRKLRNGNYLTLAKKNQGQARTKDAGDKFENLSGVAVELDKNNKIVWIWEEDKFHEDTTLRKSHINSVDIDPEEKNILIGCRDINALIEISRETGLPNYSIGYKLRNTPFVSQDFFAMQHAASYFSREEILVFNNNKAGGQGEKRNRSSIVRLARPVIKPGSTGVMQAEKQWEYVFDFDDFQHNFSAKTGGVVKMPNGNYLLASGAWNRTAEISPDKRIVWECRAWVKDTGNGTWIEQGCYRVNYSSSLYPSYFTLNNKLVSGTVNRGEEVQFSINNEGTEDDEYIVEMVSGSDKIRPVNHTVSIQKESSMMQKFLIPEYADPKTKIMITVTAVSDKSKVKKLAYVIR